MLVSLLRPIPPWRPAACPCVLTGRAVGVIIQPAFGGSLCLLLLDYQLDKRFTLRLLSSVDHTDINNRLLTFAHGVAPPSLPTPGQARI